MFSLGAPVNLYGNFKFWGHLTNFLELMGTTKRTFQNVKVMFILHTRRFSKTIFRATQLRYCDIVSNGYNIIPTLPRCVALKIIVTNRSA